MLGGHLDDDDGQTVKQSASKVTTTTLA